MCVLNKFYLQNPAFPWVDPYAAVCLKVTVKAARECPTLCDPVEYTVHGTNSCQGLGGRGAGRGAVASEVGSL